LTTLARRTESAVARKHRIEFVNADDRTEVMYLDAEERPWNAHQWAVATETLGAARDATRRAGAEFLVVYIPRKLRVYAGFLRAEPDSFAHSWRTNGLPEALGSWCRDRGIDFLDATLPLREAVAAGTSVYIADDVHWNAAGHEVVSQAIYERVRSGAWTPGDVPESRPRTDQSAHRDSGQPAE
jgi:hypothetical protein